MAMEIYEEIVKNDECVSLKDLKVSGKDLIAQGYKPGKNMGQILNELLARVIDNPDLNHKEKLLDLVNELYPKNNY